MNFRARAVREANKGDVLNCYGKMPSLRKARLPGSCNLPEQLGMSLRQVSSGKEEETRTPKPFIEILRVRIPPGKAGPAARSESCVVVG